MTRALAALLAAATVFAARNGGRRPMHLPRVSDAPAPRRALLAVVAPAALGVVLLGSRAVVASVVVMGVAVGARLLRRAKPTDPSDLALALDVLAGCLAGGATVPAALTAARAVSTDRVSRAFATAALALDRGDDPDEAWAFVGEEVPELAAVSRLCARAASTGAPIAPELHRIAASHRTALQASRRRQLQRASVWLVLPLGSCFLPAFVLVGVVPLVLGAMPRG